MFHGLTMVNFDGQTQNQMMVRPWSTMVDHGQPWSDGQTVTGDSIHHTLLQKKEVKLRGYEGKVITRSETRDKPVSNFTCLFV